MLSLAPSLTRYTITGLAVIIGSIAFAFAWRTRGPGLKVLIEPEELVKSVTKSIKIRLYNKGRKTFKDRITIIEVNDTKVFDNTVMLGSGEEKVIEVELDWSRLSWIFILFPPCLAVLFPYGF